MEGADPGADRPGVSEPSTGPLTAAVVGRARAVASTPLPSDVAVHARHCLLDWTAATVAGSREKVTSVLRAELLEDPGRPAANLLGTGERVGLVHAALINGTAAHALDFDDVVPAMSGHPSAPVFSALFPLAAELRLDGVALLAAFAAGFETACAVGRLVAPGHYGSGWHATGTLGVLGAASACAAALGLDETAWNHALGIAATSAGGLQGVFGTMAKPLHVGQAAARGLMAARLARRGFTASPAIFDTRHGFVSAFTSTPPDGPSAVPDTGNYDLRNVLFKFHAACYGVHASIEAVLHAMNSEGIEPDDVARVELRVPTRVGAGCDGPYPVTGLEAKFRVRYAAALAVTGRGTGTSVFTPEVIAEERLRAVHDRVDIVVDPTITQSFVAEADVRTTAGRTNSRRVDVTVPTPESGLDARWEKLVTKFVDLVEPVLGAGRTTQLVDAIGRVDQLDSAASIVELATPVR